MEFIKANIAIPFDRYWSKTTILSAVLVVACFVILVQQMFVKKTFNWGTDFAGGTELQVQFLGKEGKAQTAVSMDDLKTAREVLKDAGYPEGTVLRFGGEETSEVLIRIGQTSEKGKSISTDIMAALTKALGEGRVTLRKVDEVGPTVGQELKTSGLVSMILAMIGILVYIWFRFTPRFAPGAILALVHDIFITMGIFALSGFEFELPTVAALLTIVGYSINDTIVVYDRIRDNMKRARRGNLIEIVVKSLNETLSRTILTSVTTLLVVGALFSYSKGGIKDFSFVLLIGIVVGTYSSIFVATPSLVWLESRRKV